MRRALEIDEASFGEHHPTVAIRLNNLAQLLKDTNRIGEEGQPGEALLNYWNRLNWRFCNPLAMKVLESFV